jgi:uncharacterized membrane protein
MEKTDLMCELIAGLIWGVIVALVFGLCSIGAGVNSPYPKNFPIYAGIVTVVAMECSFLGKYILKSDRRKK